MLPMMLLKSTPSNMRTELTEIDERIQALYKKQESLKKQTRITCPTCHKRTQVTKATVIRDHYYIPPSGCTEGAYWTTSGEFYYYCNHCNATTRAWQHRPYNWDKHQYEDEKLPEKGRAPTRLRLLHIIRDNINYIGEVLDSYKNLQEGMSIEELRKQNEKEKERNYPDCY